MELCIGSCAISPLQKPARTDFEENYVVHPTNFAFAGIFSEDFTRHVSVFNPFSFGTKLKVQVLQQQSRSVNFGIRRELNLRFLLRYLIRHILT